MAFKTGNKLGEKRKRRRGGRPNRAEVEAKRLAAEVRRLAADAAKKYLEDRLREILDTYLALATGKAGRKRRKVDPATTRHAVERFIGPAPRALILDFQESVETFFDQIEKMGSKESKEGKTKEGGKS